jgi:hypothetical protein
MRRTRLRLRKEFSPVGFGHGQRNSRLSQGGFSELPMRRGRVTRLMFGMLAPFGKFTPLIEVRGSNPLQAECQYGSGYAVHRHGWWEHGFVLLGLPRYYSRSERCFLSPSSLDCLFWLDRVAHDNILVRYLMYLLQLNHKLTPSDGIPSDIGATFLSSSSPWSPQQAGMRSTASRVLPSSAPYPMGSAHNGQAYL